MEELRELLSNHVLLCVYAARLGVENVKELLTTLSEKQQEGGKKLTTALQVV